MSAALAAEVRAGKLRIEPLGGAAVYRCDLGTHKMSAGFSRRGALRGIEDRGFWVAQRFTAAI
jgi:hypothetical protein